jgi:hypothetical protein
MPNIARPSTVAVSMPCSMTCKPIPRSRSSAPRVTRWRAERESRSSRVIFTRVARSQQLQHEAQHGAGGLGTARGVDVDIALLYSVSQERVDLVVGLETLSGWAAHRVAGGTVVRLRGASGCGNGEVDL